MTRVRNDRVVAGVLLAWLAAATALGGIGLVARLTPPWPQVTLFALTGALIVVYMTIRGLRAWADAADIRLLIAFHLVRFVGFYFLYLYQQQRLPHDFAVSGGIGDILVAVGAVAIAFGPSRMRSRGIVLAWNTLGLLDILFVVATATRLALHDPGSMRELLILPLSLLPTFVVPIIIAIHLLLFVRLWRSPAGLEVRRQS